ncbi:MAG: glycosyltransferase family A protein [Candidatus Brocadiia bacterium]
MSQRPLVSVVMPAYNAEGFVADAIESVLAQDYRPLEVLVVDDGSTDATGDVVQAYGAPVRCLRRENGGPAAARNTALREAGGDFIAFLDADDLWHPGKLEVQAALLQARPDVGLCSARMSSFRSPEQVEWASLPAEPPVCPIPLRMLVMRNPISTSTVMARAEAVRQAGEFDEGIFGPEDWDMWRRIAQHWKVLSMGTVAAAYRQRAASVSGDARRMLANNRKVIRKSLRDNPRVPWHVRRRAWSYLHFDAAREYGLESRLRALWHTARSLAGWPAPLGREFCPALGRLRYAAAMLVRGWGRKDTRTLTEGSAP